MKILILACTDLSYEMMCGLFPRFFIAKTRDNLGELFSRADLIFSVHWHWKIPEQIITVHRVIGFHMTDLPWGVGSRPYQKVKDFRETMVTAFELDNEFDSGPILMKRHVEIGEDEESTMRRVYSKCAEMMSVLKQHDPMRVPQRRYVELKKYL